MSAITIDSRDEFEKVFPIPKYVIRCGKGYACTEYNAWDGHDFIKKWEGWSAAILHAQSDDDGEPTDDERIMAIEGIINCDRCGDEGWIVGEMGITRCACGQAGNCRENSNSATNNFREMLETSTNSPVIPDTWISVSERMPENDGAYLCWDNRYVTTYAFIFGAWQANQFIAKNITHWMPLPAAPQEVK